MYNPVIGRWMAMDPKRVGYSPYIGMGNNPTIYGDPDGRDIIILNSSTSVANQGHIGLLIGNDKDGWQYISKNGTSYGGPFGKSYNPDLGNMKYNFETGKGNDFRETGLTASQVMILVNEYHVEVNGGEEYDNYIRVSSNSEQDSKALQAAKDQASSFYDVCYSSCLDVAKDAFQAIGFKQPISIKPIVRLPYNNMNELVPNTWFKNFGWYNNNQRYNLVPRAKTPQIIVEPIQILEYFED